MTPEGGKGRRGKKEGKVKSAPLQLKEKEGRADNNLLNKCQCMFTLLKEFKHFSVLICLSVCLFVWAGEMAQPLKAAVAIAKYLVWFPASTRWLTTIVSGPLATSVVQYMCIHTGKTSTHVH